MNVKWMHRVLDLARLAEGQTAPNPMVGCVVVKDDREIGSGWHKGPGQWHAEREVLLTLGTRAKGAELYVNLEPCCHFGRTPPCTDIIIECGVKRVYIGMVDPDPRMAGRGIAQLKAAGIEVVVGVEERKCRQLNDAYLLARTQHRPRFTAKVACSLDGFICDSFGNSQWITNSESRQAGHRLRHTHDGILVGIGTILADDPSLNTRCEGGQNARPIVLDSNYRTPHDAKVRTAGLKPLIFHSTTQEEGVYVDREASGVNLEQVAQYLVSENIYSVLVEGGSGVLHSLFLKKWIDRVEIFQAPILLGDGKKWMSNAACSLFTAPHFVLMGTNRYKSDIRLSYRKSDNV